ncbi:MAG: DUF2993 domain-containing protein [Glaciihabitans sp.]
MEREPGSFDWGTTSRGDGTPRSSSDSSSGASAASSSSASASSATSSSYRPSFDDQFLTPDPTDYNPFEAKKRLEDEAVSYEADDLGFTTTYVARKSVARRLIGPIIFLVVFVGLIVGATLGADNLARDAVGGLISSKVASTLETKTDPEVDLGEGLFISQAIGGEIDHVVIDVDAATFGGLTGNLVIDATGVPTTPSDPTKNLGISYTLDEASAASFASRFKPNSKSVVTFGNDEVIVASKVKAAGKNRLFTVTFTPSVVEGALVLTAKSVALGDDKPVTPEKFLDSRYAKAGAEIVDERTVCVASNLPETLILTGVSVAPDGLTLAAKGENVRISGDLTTLGICA